MSLFAAPAALVNILGPPLGLPPYGKIDSSLAPATLGAIILGVGVLLGRSRE